MARKVRRARSRRARVGDASESACSSSARRGDAVRPNASASESMLLALGESALLRFAEYPESACSDVALAGRPAARDRGSQASIMSPRDLAESVALGPRADAVRALGGVRGPRGLRRSSPRVQVERHRHLGETSFSTREALASMRQMASLLPAVGDETGGRANVARRSTSARSPPPLPRRRPRRRAVLAPPVLSSLRRCGSGDGKLDRGRTLGAGSSSRPRPPSDGRRRRVDARDLHARSTHRRRSRSPRSSARWMGVAARRLCSRAPPQQVVRASVLGRRRERARSAARRRLAAAEAAARACSRAAQFDAAASAAALSAERRSRDARRRPFVDPRRDDAPDGRCFPLTSSPPAEGLCRRRTAPKAARAAPSPAPARRAMRRARGARPGAPAPPPRLFAAPRPLAAGGRVAGGAPRGSSDAAGAASAPSAPAASASARRAPAPCALARAPRRRRARRWPTARRAARIALPGCSPRATRRTARAASGTCASRAGGAVRSIPVVLDSR